MDFWTVEGVLLALALSLEALKAGGMLAVSSGAAALSRTIYPAMIAARATIPMKIMLFILWVIFLY